MTKFEKLRQELTDKAKTKNACASEYKRALSAKTEAELLKVIYDNLGWCSENEVVNNTYLCKFNAADLLASGCANTGIENTGLANSGYSNSGDWNSGYRNSSDSNSGDRNSGDRNSGDSNSGYRNSSNWNSGDRNSGYRNSGDRNSGDSNSGYRNSGNWNSGDRNSGDSNSGYRNSGAFCTDKNPTLFLFNKPAKMSMKDWENSAACQAMYNIENTLWIPSSKMTDKEKENNPKHETTEGYLKTIPIKEAWANAWPNFTDSIKKSFTELENFDSTIFEEITGIKI